MATFSPAFLEEIRNRLSLSGTIGARVRLTRAGREFKGCCPFHNEKSPSFYVNDEKQFFHCFGCGAHGDVIGFTMRHDRLSFPEAIENLAGQAGMEMPRDTPVEREKYDQEKRLYQLLERVTAWYEEQLFLPTGHEALAYLHGRGLSDDAIRRFHLGYSPHDGQSLLRKMTGEGFSLDELIATGLAKKADPLRQRDTTQTPPNDAGVSVARDRNDHYSFFRNRVMFPVGDRRGRTVAFGARVLGEGEPKYLNSPDHVLFHKGKLLYGLSRARAALSQGQPIIVVEGYMDVISLAEAGYTGAVAPLGTALTEDQIHILWKLLPSQENREASRDYSPIVCFDGDNAGVRAAARTVERVLPLLTPAQTLRIATITGAKDPDELIRRSGKGAFDALLKQAMPMIDVLWNLTLAGRATRTPEERGACKDILRGRVMQIKDEGLRRLYGDAFKKRIDEAFGWKPQNNNAPQQGGSWNREGKNRWKNQTQQAPAPFINRAPPQAKKRQMEKILLALMINHPVLFDEFGENLTAIDFQTPEFEQMRQRVIDLLAQAHDAPLDAPELRRALADHGEDRIVYEDNSGVLDEILSPETYLHAKGAHPAADTDAARRTWQGTWGLHEQDVLRAELETAKRRHSEQPTDENYQQLMALQAQIHQAQRAVGED